MSSIYNSGTFRGIGGSNRITSFDRKNGISPKIIIEAIPNIVSEKTFYDVQDFLSNKLPFNSHNFTNVNDNLTYCKIFNNYSLFTIGEKRNGYFLTGVPDGVSGYLLSDNTIRIFFNSEFNDFSGYNYKLENNTILTGARVQFIDFNRRTFEVVNCGLAYNKIYNSNYQLVSETNKLDCHSYVSGKNSNNNDIIVNNTKGLEWLCSNSFYPKHYWNKLDNETNGFQDNILFTGEEAATPYSRAKIVPNTTNVINDINNIYPNGCSLVRGGLAWALDITNNALHAIPKLGRGPFENVVSVDLNSNDYIGLVSSRESFTTDLFSYYLSGEKETKQNGGAFILLYIGKKNKLSSDFLSRNGLKDGQLYAMFLKGSVLKLPSPISNNYTGDNIDIIFLPIPAFDDNMASFYKAVRSINKSGYTLYTANKVEDLCSNPENGCEFIYAHEPLTQIEYVKFDTPNLNNGFPLEITGISKVLFKNTNVMNKCNNLSWSKNGKIFVCEDNSDLSTLPKDSNNKLVLNSDNTYKENVNHILYLKFLYKNINDLNSGYIGNYERIINLPSNQYNLNISDLMSDMPIGSPKLNEPSGITDITPLMVLPFGHSGKDFRENLDAKFMLYVVQAHGLKGGKIEREKLVEGGQFLLSSIGYSTVQELKDKNISISEIRKIFQLSQLKEAFSLSELKNSGFTLSELKTQFNLSELKTQFNLSELKTQFTIAELKDNGFTLAELKNIFFPSELAKNYTLLEMKNYFVINELYLYYDISVVIPNYSILELNSVYQLNILKNYFTFDELIIYFDEATLNANGIFRPVVKTLFFSKYMEGSSNNKAVEIYNPTNNDIALDLYAIPYVINGVASSANVNQPEGWFFFNVNSIIKANSKYLIINPSTTIINPNIADFVPSSSTAYPTGYNGDDGIKLVKFNNTTDKMNKTNYTILDTIGTWTTLASNTAPWNIAGVTNATQDKTIVRKPTIVKGNPDWTLAAGTNNLDSEWIVYPQNTISGTYSDNLGLPSLYVGITWKLGDASPVIISTVSISNINGLKHTSNYNNLIVKTNGVVTAKNTSGFYIQDGINNSLGSCGLFVYTGISSNYLTMVQTGDSIEITASVSEYGYTNALTITELINITSLIIKSTNNTLPTPINIGKTYNNVPPLQIDNNNISDFNPSSSALDYWENYEGMLVTLQNPKIIGQNRAFGEFSLVIDVDNPTRVYSKYGGIILNKDNENPDIITAVNTLMPSDPIFTNFYPGDTITSITGIVSYDYGHFKILPRNLNDFGIVTNGEISRDIIAVKGTPTPPAYRAKEALNSLSYEHLSIMSTNQFNLSVKVNEIRVSDYIRINLKSPEIIFVQEIQDDSGVTDDGVVSSDNNLAFLVSLLNNSKYDIYSTRNYGYVYVSPENNQDGGVPGGNIRNAICYNTNNLEVLEYKRIGLSTETDAFSKPSGSRKPLYVKIKYNPSGEIYHLINVHNKSKSGDSSPWGSLQPPVQFSLPQRIEQTTYIKNWILNNLNKTTDNIIISGDFNDYEWSDSLKILDDNTSNRFMKNLVNDIPENARYSFYFNGTYHAIDQMIVSDKIYDAIKTKNNTTDITMKKDYITYSDVLSTQFWILSLGESLLVDHNPVICRIPF